MKILNNITKASIVFFLTFQPLLADSPYFLDFKYILNQSDAGKKAQTFLKTKNGYQTTGQEGYVAIDKLGGDAVKIVDRMEFSYANFSPDILKGWDKPGRNWWPN